ncbi:hypothetical protein [Natrononativus amylolyticus]|uniref:hypothetical protein n=1 Tax=Natrononativus amylolyticus TaxID=2963434 RepID=UPI0020CB7A05|nr:hypothetical protein [Natrononativus amylolyticus]
MTDEEWNDPEPGVGLDRRRLKIRLGCAAVALFVLVVATWSFLVDALPLLWPPTEPLAQWSTLVLLSAFGYVLVPLMIGSLVADVLLERLE